jgi:hypothetical protein
MIGQSKFYEKLPNVTPYEMSEVTVIPLHNPLTLKKIQQATFLFILLPYL